MIRLEHALDRPHRPPPQTRTTCTSSWRWSSRAMARAADTMAISRAVVSRTIANLEHTAGRCTAARPRAARRRADALWSCAAQAQRRDLRRTGKACRMSSSWPIPILARCASAARRRWGRDSSPRVIDRLASNIRGWCSNWRSAPARRQLDITSCASARCDPGHRPPMDGRAGSRMSMWRSCSRIQIRVVTGPRSEMAQADAGTELADLVDEPWVPGAHRCEPGSPAVRDLQACGLPVPQATVLSYSLNERNSMLATGRFLAIMPASVLPVRRRACCSRSWRLDLVAIAATGRLAILKNRMLNPAAQLFIDARGGEALGQGQAARGRQAPDEGLTSAASVSASCADRRHVAAMRS